MPIFNEQPCFRRGSVGGMLKEWMRTGRAIHNRTLYRVVLVLKPNLE